MTWYIMSDIEIREAANRMIGSITEREGTDIRIPPAMVALIMIIYIAVTIYYVASIYSRYDIIPIQQMFTMTALFTIGAALVIAIMYTLITRNRRHSEREAKLRAALIEYTELNDQVCGYDLSQYAATMRKADEVLREYESTDGRHTVIPIFIPVFISLVLLCINDLRQHMIPIITVTFVLALFLSVQINPELTRFPKRHDDGSAIFYETFEEAAPFLDLRVGEYTRIIGYRSFWVFIILSIVTLGIFLVYWVYLMFRDMNMHFDMQWAYEDTLFVSIRKKEKGIKYGIDRRGPGDDDTYEDDDIEDPVYEETFREPLA